LLILFRFAEFIEGTEHLISLSNELVDDPQDELLDLMIDLDDENLAENITQT